MGQSLTDGQLRFGVFWVRSSGTDSSREQPGHWFRPWNSNSLGCGVYLISVWSVNLIFIGLFWLLKVPWFFSWMLAKWCVWLWRDVGFFCVQWAGRIPRKVFSNFPLILVYLGAYNLYRSYQALLHGLKYWADKAESGWVTCQLNSASDLPRHEPKAQRKSRENISGCLFSRKAGMTCLGGSSWW